MARHYNGPKLAPPASPVPVAVARRRAAAYRVSVAVQTHPKRLELARQLGQRIGGELVVDPEPDGYPSPWRTYRTALEATPASATHRLIVQDDAVPHRWFNQAVRAAVRAKPDVPLVLFVAGHPRQYKHAVHAANQQGRPWARLDMSSWCPTIAVVWPKPLIRPCLEWVEAQGWPPQFRADDEIVGRYFRHAGIRPLATVPCLAQHPDLIPSLIGRRTSNGLDPARVAACWCPDFDVRKVDWTANP